MGLGIGGALAIGAGVSAAAGIGGALISSSASKDAAKTQAAAANRSADLQLQEQQQVRSDLAPFRDIGNSAATKLAWYTMGEGTGDTEMKALENTPGYQFARDQGLKSVQNSAAARGLGTSGAALKGAANFATGLAQNTYQANLLNPLEFLSTQGENAAAQTGTLGTQGAANAGAGITGAGNALAAGTVGSANALAGGLNNLGGAPMNYLLYNRLLGGGGGSGGSSAGSGGGYYDSGTWDV